MFGNYLNTTPVAIFPGHHGKDPGAIDGVDKDRDENDKLFTVEAALNCELSQKLHHTLLINGILSKIYKGNFTQRINESNEDDCCLGISIHHNAASATSANGWEILHYPGSTKANLVCKIIEARLQSFNLETHGMYPIKERGDLVILRKTKFPTILFEGGFMTNPNEEKLIIEEYYQGFFSVAIAAAVQQYICTLPAVNI